MCKLTETSPEQLQEVTLELAERGGNPEEETDERLWNNTRVRDVTQRGGGGGGGEGTYLEK